MIALGLNKPPAIYYYGPTTLEALIKSIDYLLRKVLLLPSQPKALDSIKSWQNNAVDLINYLQPNIMVIKLKFDI